MNNKLNPIEINKELSKAVSAGFLEVFCKCGRQITSDTVLYKNSKKSEAYVKKLMKQKGISEKDARHLTLEEFMKKVGF